MGDIKHYVRYVLQSHGLKLKMYCMLIFYVSSVTIWLGGLIHTYCCCKFYIMTGVLDLDPNVKLPSNLQNSLNAWQELESHLKIQNWYCTFLSYTGSTRPTYQDHKFTRWHSLSMGLPEFVGIISMLNHHRLFDYIAISELLQGFWGAELS